MIILHVGRLVSHLFLHSLVKRINLFLEGPKTSRWWKRSLWDVLIISFFFIIQDIPQILILPWQLITSSTTEYILFSRLPQHYSLLVDVLSTKPLAGLTVVVHINCHLRIPGQIHHDNIVTHHHCNRTSLHNNAYRNWPFDQHCPLHDEVDVLY